MLLKREIMQNERKSRRVERNKQRGVKSKYREKKEKK
jgi:hypothetical protein